MNARENGFPWGLGRRRVETGRRGKSYDRAHLILIVGKPEGDALVRVAAEGGSSFLALNFVLTAALLQLGRRRRIFALSTPFIAACALGFFLIALAARSVDHRR